MLYEYETSLGLDIDVYKTANNVRRFLENDFKLFLWRGGLHKVDLSSPSFDSVGSSGAVGNGQEQKIMKIFDYQSKALAIYQAIEQCEHNENLGVYSRDILHSLYVLDLTDVQTMERLLLAEATYYRKKRLALCEFADRVQVTAYKLDTDIPDLRYWR